VFSLYKNYILILERKMSINKLKLKNIIVCIALLIPVQSVFAQTGTTIVPATEIMSTPLSVENAPVTTAVMAFTNSGAWSNQGSGPAIYSKNILDTLIINPSGYIPPTAKITAVSWSWGISYKPVGLSVRLCYDAINNCFGITNLQNGSASNFNNLLANKKMILTFNVQGTGMMTPAYGQIDRVIVSYQY